MTVRVGIIGTGWVAQDRHVPGFRSHPEAQIVTVFDRQPDRARAAANKARIPHWSADLAEFFDQGLDVVSIATPPWTHAELAESAFAAGAHVFTEKPMAMNLAEAQGMVEASRATGRLLCVSHNFLFSRAVRRAERFLGANADLRYGFGVQLSSLRRRLPVWYQDLPGGLAFDEMPHLLYLLHHFLGALEVDHVRTVRPPTGEGHSIEVLLAGARAPGQMTMVFDAPVSEWQVVLTGVERVVALDLFRDIAIGVNADGAHKPLDILRTSGRALAGHAAGFVASGARYATGRQAWGHDRLISAFVDATLGRREVPVSTQDALGVVRAADRIVGALADLPVMR